MQQRKYRRLVVWQKAMDLVSAIYEITNQLPGSEKFGLANQLRRAAVSVPSNIAEGSGRGSDKEFVRFLHIAKGSLLEIETQLLIAIQLKFIKQADDILELIDHLFAITNKLIARTTASVGN